MTKTAARAILFIGWILSPMTSWNDLIVNLPLAYILASVHNRLFQHMFPASIVIYYWLTNIAGILMTYIGAKALAVKRFDKEKIKGSVLTIIIYTCILAILSFKGIITPFPYGR